MSQLSEHKDISNDIEEDDCEDSNRYPKKLCRAGTPRPKDFKESINAALTSLGISKLHLNDAIASRQLKHNQSDLPKNIDINELDDESSNVNTYSNSKEEIDLYGSDSDSCSSSDESDESEDEDSDDENNTVYAKNDIDVKCLSIYELILTSSLKEICIEYNYSLLDYYCKGDEKIVQYINSDEQMFQLIEFLTYEFEKENSEDKRAINIAEKIFTSYQNTSVIENILSKEYLLERFFSCLDSEFITPQWCRVFFYWIYEHGIDKIFNYLGMLSNNDSFFESNKFRISKGYKLLLSLFSHLKNHHVIKILLTLLTNDSSYNWNNFVSMYDVKEIIMNRLIYISSLPINEYDYITEQESYNLCVLLEEILKKYNFSMLYQHLNSLEFTSLLLNIVFSPKPHPFAHYCINIVLRMFEEVFNKESYTSTNIPPIIENFLDNIIKQENDQTCKPLDMLKYFIDNPILQISITTFGTYRLKIIKIIDMIIKTNYGILHKELIYSGILTLCFDLISKFPSNTVLHNKVTEIINNLLEMAEPDWIVDWIRQNNLINRLIEYIENDKMTESIPMYLAICKKIEDVAEEQHIIKNLLNEHEKWLVFYESIVVKKLKEYTSLGNICDYHTSNLYSIR